MSLIKERFGKKAVATLGPVLNTPNRRYDFVGGQLVSIPDNVGSYVKDGYNASDLIYSVINLILEKIKMAPFNVYRVKDESSLKQYKALNLKGVLNPNEKIKARKLLHKALEVVDNPGRWGELLKYPNERQTFSELAVDVIGGKMLMGNGFLYANLLDSGNNKGMPSELWSMKPQGVVIFATRQFPCKLLGYTYQDVNIREYGANEIMHIKYPNFSGFDTITELWGTAPLKSALMLVNLTNSADKAAAALYQNRGLQHVLYIDVDNITAEDRAAALGQMAELKKKLVTEYTGPENHGKIAGTSYKMGAINLGLTAEEFQIIETQKWSLRRYCNIFGGVPSQTLNDPENKTYSNMKEGEVSLTTRAVLPQLQAFRDGFNRMAHEHWGLKPEFIIDYDQTVYSELQDDLKEMSQWLLPMAKATGLPPNRILDLLGLETIDNPYYDIPRVTTEMGDTIEEREMNEIDNMINNGEAGNSNNGQGGNEADDEENGND